VTVFLYYLALSDVDYSAIRDSLVSLYDIRVPLSVVLAYPLINIITPVIFTVAGLCYVTPPPLHISWIKAKGQFVALTNLFRIASYFDLFCGVKFRFEV